MPAAATAAMVCINRTRIPRAFMGKRLIQIFPAYLSDCKSANRPIPSGFRVLRFVRKPRIPLNIPPVARGESDSEAKLCRLRRGETALGYRHSRREARTWLRSDWGLSASHDLDDARIGCAPRRRAVVRKPARGVIPMQGRHIAGAVFVGIGCSVIGEQRKAGVGARINTNLFDRLLLAGAFDRRPQ